MFHIMVRYLNFVYLLNSKEKKIRTGSALPADSVNLAYFKVDEVSPENTLTVIDLSSSIKENFIDYKMFFAPLNAIELLIKYKNKIFKICNDLFPQPFYYYDEYIFLGKIEKFIKNE